MEESRPRRANGEGSLYEDTARGRWRGFVSWTDQDGKLRRRSWSGTKAHVKREMAKAQRELAEGRLPASRRTLADYLEGWLKAERARVRPATWKYRDGHVRLYIVPALGSRTLAELQPRDVEKMTADMVERGLSPTTAAGCRTTLRKALGDAVRDGLVPRNVAALARPPRQQGRVVEYLTRDELRKLLAASENQLAGPLVILASTTGMRQGELLGLAWSAIDIEARTLTVRQAMARSWEGYELAEPKTARSRRTIHLPDPALEALEVRRATQDAEREVAGADWQDTDGLVFTDRLGRPMQAHDANKAFHAIREKAGLRAVPFHALRHSWATLAVASGVPLKVIADNLGHASITVTAAFYSGIVPELNRDAADAVGKALS